MNDTLKEKMDLISDYYLSNSVYFKEQLENLLKPIENEHNEEFLTKEIFSKLFINLHVKILYIDVKSLDFICGDKIVKILFTKSLFKGVSLSPESGDIFKIEPHHDRRIKSIFYLSSLLTFTTFTVLDFKYLESIRIFNNNDPEITDIYYGGLFKLKEIIEKQESKTQKMLNVDEISNSIGSLFHKETNSKPIFTPEENFKTETSEPSKDYKYLEIKEYYKVKINPFELIEDDINKVYTKNMSEFVLSRAIRTINFIYSTTIKEVDLAIYLINNRLNSLDETIIHAICILRDENTTYVLEIDADGGIKVTLDLVANVKDIVFHLHRVLRRNSLNNDLRERNNFRYKSF